MTWEELGRGTRELAEAIHTDGYVPDMVLAIARGGLLVAGALGYALDVKTSQRCDVKAPMPPLSFLTRRAFSLGTANP